MPKSFPTSSSRISWRRPDLRLPRSARLLSRLVTFLPVLCFLLAASVYCVKLGRVLSANLSPIAANEAGRYLHRQVRLGKIGLSPSALSVTGLAVSNGPTFASKGGETLASADRIVVHYSLHDLLFDSKDAAHAFGDVELYTPTALVEVLPGKKFNFSDLLTPRKKTKSRPYDGRILVHNGSVVLRDFTAPANPALRPAVNSLSAANVLVDLHSERFVYFGGTAHGDGKRIANVAVSGDASRMTAGRFRASVQISDADAAYWSTYFKSLPNLRVLTGRAAADVTVSRLSSRPALKLPLDIFGLVTARNASVALTDPRVSHLPLQHVSGDATFTGASVTINGSARAGGQAVRFAGTIADFLDPQVAFAGAADHVDALHLASFFPQLHLPPGLSASPMTARVRVTGSAKDPVWGVDAAAPALHLQGQTATNVQVHAVYAGGIVSFSPVAFTVAQGQGTLRATVNTASLPAPTLALGGRINGANLAALPLPPTVAKPVTLGGRADVAFLVTGTTAVPSVIANVHVMRPAVAQTTFHALSGRVAWRMGQPVTVRRAVLDDGRGGVLTASGTVRTPGTVEEMGAAGGWNLAVSAAGADIHSLLTPYLPKGATPTDIGGLAYAQARVTGPLTRPSVAGDVQVYGGHVNTIAADAVTGHIITNGDALRLSGVTVRRYPTEATVSGTVNGLRSGSPALNLSASVAQADVADLLSLARPAGQKNAVPLPDITGTASAALHIGGTARAPQVAAHADVEDATVGAYRLRRVQADAAYDGKTVHVARLQVQEEETGAILSGHGHWNPQSGQVAAVLNAQNVNLSLLRPVTQNVADLRGTLSASADVRGTVTIPVADVRVSGQDLSADGQALAPLTLAGRYAAGAFTKTDAPWTLTFLPSPGAPVSYVVDALRVALPSPQQPKRPIALAVRAHVPENAPEHVAHLLDILRGSRFANQPAVLSLLGQADALPAPPNGTLWLPTLTARGPLSAPSLTAQVEARGLSIGTDSLQTLSASLSYAGGPDPAAHLDLSAGGLKAANVLIDTVTARGDYSHRTVTVDALDARSRAAYLHGSGRAALDGDMDAALDVSDVPLSLFTPFVQTPGAPHRALSGTVSAFTVQASGKTHAPQFIASVSLDKPGLDTSPVPPATSGGTHFTLDSVRSGAVTLAAPAPGTTSRILTVTDLTAFKAGRQIASVSGSVPLALGGAQAIAALPPGQPLSATAQIADLSVLALLAPDTVDAARTAGSLSASVSVGANGQMQGTAELKNGALGLTGFDTSLKDIAGRAVLTGNRLQVQFGLSSSRDGQINVTGGGTVGKGGQAALRVTARRFAVDETGKGSFLARVYGSGGKATVDGGASVTGPWQSPLVSTASAAPLIVSGASVALPTISPPGGGAKSAPPVDPRFDLTLLLGGEKSGTVSARSSLLRADARGDLHIGGSLNAPVLRSHLTVAKGQFYLPPSTTLKVVRPASGENNVVDLRYDAANPPIGTDGTAQPGLETRVNLTAQATVTVSGAAQAQSGSVLGTTSGGIGAPTLPTDTALQNTAFSGTGRRGQRYTITAHITGLLNVPDKLTLDLSSSPVGLSKTQMLAALVQEDAYGSLFAGGTSAENAFKTQVGAALYSAALPSLLSPLKNGVINTFGLEDFSVDYSPDAPTLVTLSKELAPRLLATYTRLVGARASGTQNAALGTQPQYTLKLSYGIAGRLQLSVSTDDQRENTLALEGVFGF